MKNLLSFSRSLASEQRLTSLFAKIMSEAHEIIRAERATMFLCDEVNEELYSIVSQGSDPIRVPVGVGLVGACGRTGELLIIDDAYQDARFNSAFDKRSGFRTKSVLCAPIFSPQNGDLIAVLQFINKEGGKFVEEDFEIIKAFSSHLGSAIENCSKLFDESFSFLYLLKRSA